MGLTLYAVVLVLFASFCSLHVWLCLQLLTRSARRAILGFFLVPLAPYFGLSLGLRRVPTAWILCGCLYVIFLILALVLPAST